MYQTIYSLIRGYYEREVVRKNCTFRLYDITKANIGLVAEHFAPRDGKADPRKVGFFLCGRTGQGKTSILRAVNAMLCQLIDEGQIKSYESDRYPIMVNASEIARMATNDLSGYERLKRCDRLLIDDVGAEASEVMSYGVPLHPMEDLLAYRYEQRAKTFMVSNYSYTELFCNTEAGAAKYPDPRLEDRIYETLNIITFQGGSYR